MSASTMAAPALSRKKRDRRRRRWRSNSFRLGGALAAEIVRRRVRREPSRSDFSVIP
jgi:hypothetical protein